MDIVRNQSPFLASKENLLRWERNGMLSSVLLSEQHNPTSENKRNDIVDWLMGVSKKMKYKIETFCLAVNLFDGYITRTTIIIDELNLIALASLVLASRYVEISNVKCEDLSSIIDKTLETKVTRYTKDIFQVLGCNINFPNDYNYLEYCMMKNIEKEELAALLLKITYFEYIDITSVLPSLKASSIYYLISLYRGVEYNNIFNVDYGSVVKYSAELIKLFNIVSRSSFMNWKASIPENNKAPILDQFYSICGLIVNDSEVVIDKQYLKLSYLKRDLLIQLISEGSGMFKHKIEKGGSARVDLRYYEGEYFAVKTLLNYGCWGIGEDDLSESYLREVSIILSLQHPNIIEARYITKDFLSIYLDYGIDLHNYVRFQGAGEYEYVDKQIDLAYQLLKGLVYMHDNGVIHRDLKPQNIIVFSDGNYDNDGEDEVITYRIADFGAARGTNIPLRNNKYTQGICTLWYRSPEVLLEEDFYGDRLDVWSLACLLYECVVEKVMFASSSEIGQLSAIFLALGPPDETTWPGVTQLKNYIPSFGNITREQDNEDLIDNEDSLTDCFKDIIKAALVVNPSLRPSSRKLLNIVDAYLE